MTELKEGALVRHVTGGAVMVVETVNIVGVAIRATPTGYQNSNAPSISRAMLPESSLVELTPEERDEYFELQRAERAIDAQAERDANAAHELPGPGEYVEYDGHSGLKVRK